MSLRPERQAPPEFFYNETEARKYTTSSRIIDIQVLRTLLLLHTIRKKSVFGLLFNGGVVLCLSCAPAARASGSGFVSLHVHI